VVGGWRFSDLIHSPPFHWGARAASFVWIFWLPLIVYVALGLLSARGRALQGLGPPARRFTPVGTWLERRFLSWWFVALTTALGVFAGFLGATWEKSVSASTERNLQAISSFAGDADFEGMKNTVDGLGHLFHEEGRSQTTAVEDGERARWFYAFASLFAVSFGVTLWSQTRAADRASSEMDAQTRELGRAVVRLQTLPPAGFLKAYEEIIPLSLRRWFIHSLTMNLSETAIVQYIQTQLVGVLDLVKYFGKAEHGGWSCNVMILRPTTTLQPDKRADLETIMRFCEPEAALDKMFGALEYLPQLSASQDRQGKPLCPDRSHQERFCLPVPQPDTRRGEPALPARTLPGAPKAVLTRQSQAFKGKVDEDAFMASRYVTEGVKEEWLKTYRDDIRIVSFMSFPILDGASAGSNGLPIGVLNVHADREVEDLVEKMQVLYPLITPILGSLSVLLKLYGK
jgi:hypothetical protein